MRLLTIFGTRPEAIKLAPAIKRFEAQAGFHSTVCVTGQHREMLDQVLELYGITPDVDLKVMQPNQTLASLTARALEAVDRVVEDMRPDVIVVQGDTTTSLVGGLAGYYHKIPVAHVEAGLRTNDPYSPWPEEMNRQLVGRLAYLHFAPTRTAAANLAREGIPEDRIHLTGNTVIDALQDIAQRLDTNPDLAGQLEETFPDIRPDRKMILVTGHRRENFGSGFREICNALQGLSKRSDVQIVYPVHLNPNVKGPVHELLGDADNVVLVEPQPYLNFVHLMRKADIILTDSGGIQEEAPAFGKPVVVMRTNTERPEAVEAGTAVLAGADAGNIVREVERLLDDEAHYRSMASAHNPFGDGHAAERIVRILGEKIAARREQRVEAS